VILPREEEQLHPTALRSRQTLPTLLEGDNVHANERQSDIHLSPCCLRATGIIDHTALGQLPARIQRKRKTLFRRSHVGVGGAASHLRKRKTFSLTHSAHEHRRRVRLLHAFSMLYLDPSPTAAAAPPGLVTSTVRL
jgi:hypothetical protein